MSVFSRIDLKFRLPDWFFNIDYPGDYSVHEALERLQWMNSLCIYGEQEKDSLGRSLAKDQYNTVMLPGGHHFHHDYGLLMSEIDKALQALN